MVRTGEDLHPLETEHCRKVLVGSERPSEMFMPKWKALPFSYQGWSLLLPFWKARLQATSCTSIAANKALKKEHVRELNENHKFSRASDCPGEYWGEMYRKEGFWDRVKWITGPIHNICYSFGCWVFTFKEISFHCSLLRSPKSGVQAQLLKMNLSEQISGNQGILIGLPSCTLLCFRDNLNQCSSNLMGISNTGTR